MAYVGDTYRISYIAKNFTTGLTDVKMVVSKPDGSIQGIYTLTEFSNVNFQGVYYYDYPDSDIEGEYLFVVNSATLPKKDAKSVTFENRVWTTTNRDTILTDVDFIKEVESGRWFIDETTNEMIFYKSDNVTELMRFDLKDKNGNPATIFPYERVKQ